MYGQISGDSRSIIAVQRDEHTLVLYDVASHTRKTLAEVVDYPRWSQDGKFVYFNNFYFSGKGRKGGINRWNPKTNEIETLLKFPDFLLAGATA